MNVIEKLRKALDIGEGIEDLLKALPIETEVLGVEVVDDGVLITIKVKER